MSRIMQASVRALRSIQQGPAARWVPNGCPPCQLHHSMGHGLECTWS